MHVPRDNSRRLIILIGLVAMVAALFAALGPDRPAQVADVPSAATTSTH